jgi:hypothetical protein
MSVGMLGFALIMRFLPSGYFLNITTQICGNPEEIVGTLGNWQTIYVYIPAA